MNIKIMLIIFAVIIAIWGFSVYMVVTEVGRGFEDGSIARGLGGFVKELRKASQ